MVNLLLQMHYFLLQKVHNSQVYKLNVLQETKKNTTTKNLNQCAMFLLSHTVTLSMENIFQLQLRSVASSVYLVVRVLPGFIVYLSPLMISTCKGSRVGAQGLSITFQGREIETGRGASEAVR